MKDWQNRDRWIIVFFSAFSGFILFFNLGGRSLENHSYIKYAEVAREMIRSGEWVVPHLNGEIFINKPPLLFWLIALPSSLYGSVTPLIARLPSALSAWIGILVLFLWTQKVYGTTRCGLIAAGVVLSSYQYFHQSRLPKTDMLFLLFVILSLYFFHLGYGETRKGRRYALYGLSFFSMGLGTLTKGPFGFFMPLLVGSIFLVKEKQWKKLFSKEFLFGYGVLALTVLPWVILFIGRVGWEECITLIKGNRILSRHAPIYFYFIEIWGQFFPWSVLLPFLFLHIWRQKAEIWNSRESFFSSWFVVLFVVLTLFKFRTSRYLFPALPPLAIMIGGMWKKKSITFVIVFLLAIFFWHGRDILWIQKDPSYSPGMGLVKELKPFLKGKTLLAYRLDTGTLEEMNFYLDPPVPITLLKKVGPLNKSEQERKEVVLMPKRSYENSKADENNPITFIEEFNYKKTKLVLASYE
jgi:4-amino-4-deoxy-L-arabinose transferase-like glycosyltransferase